MNKTEPTIETLDQFCSKCDRVPWGDIVRTGHGHWRHSHCAIGSTEWLVWYQSLPLAKQAAYVDFFNLCYPEVGGNHDEKTTIEAA